MIKTEGLMHLKELPQRGRQFFFNYICVNELGVRIRPNYVTTAFPKLLEEHGLRKIRFHDLRHSCASLLLANNVPMKQIQD